MRKRTSASSPRAPRRTVSPERKGLYTVGLALQVVGGLVIAVGFIGFATAGHQSVQSMGQSGSPIAWWIACVIGMLAVGGGGAIRHVAARGVAGSGLILDPERARDDLEPWARTGGGLLRDALDETGIGGPTPRDDPVVKVRCRECGTLNDEDARFCDACGGKL